MEVTVNGEKMQLVGNPPEVGAEIPHFKLFDAQNQRVKWASQLYSQSYQTSIRRSARCSHANSTRQWLNILTSA